MKILIAYIKPHKLSAVTIALHGIAGLSGMSVVDARGFGRGRTKGSTHTVQEDLVDFIPSRRLEIVCADDLVEEIVATIQREAHTGLRGDGKIFVGPIDDAVRISTGQHGDAAA